MSDDIKAPESHEIPEDLKLKIAAIKSLVSIHDLLNRGSFEGFLAERVLGALAFIGSLQTQMVEEAKLHECAHLVEGLTESLPT